MLVQKGEDSLQYIRLQVIYVHAVIIGCRSRGLLALLPPP